MKVKLLTAMATFRRGYPSGAIADLPDADARRMIDRGLAEPVRNNPTEIPAPTTRGEQTIRRPAVERRRAARSAS